VEGEGSTGGVWGIFMHPRGAHHTKARDSTIHVLCQHSTVEYWQGFLVACVEWHVFKASTRNLSHQGH
jgi:hypothetical protein